MLSTRLLLSIVSALLVCASAALVISSPPVKTLSLDVVNTTNSSPEAPSGHLQNLTYRPWPAQPYSIPIDSDSPSQFLVINSAYRFYGTRSISVPTIQEFLREFRDNLEQKSPIPGFVPRVATQYHIDILSYTEWTIDLNEGIFGHRLPTEVALDALDEIARLVGRHGPSLMFFSIRTEGFMYSYGFLHISEFGGSSVDETMANENSNFQTS